MKTIFEIQNLKCGGCENTIKKNLNKFEFVNNLEVDTERSTVSMDALLPDCIDFVIRALSNMGYPIIEETNSLSKKTRSFVSCAIGRIQK